LDGDGKFDDAQGPVAHTQFRKPGAYRVRLEVADDHGATARTSRVVDVRRAEAPHFVSSPPAPPLVATTPPAATTVSGTRHRFVRTPLAPFPVVRARGRILRGGVVIDLLSVRTAPGAHVTVRCRARRCPARVARVRIAPGHAGVRVHAFERWLPTGTVLQVFVTGPRHLGKYTRFLIRGGRPPARRDLCIRSVLARPMRCPF
jgi:hypothetical protein